MEHSEKKLSEKESLALITTMINKAKESYHSTGIGSIMWGVVIAICSMVKLAEIHFQFRLPFDIYLLTFVAVIPQIFITIREKKKRKVKSYDDVYMDYLWLGFGITIFLMIHLMQGVFNAWEPLANEYNKLSGQPVRYRFHEFISPLFLILYGMPTFVTGAACKFKPMLWGGLICWVSSIVTVYTSVKIDLILTAVSAIASWLIPGILMEKEYRIYKKEQAAQHV